MKSISPFRFPAFAAAALVGCARSVLACAEEPARLFDLRYEWFIYREAGMLRGGSLFADGAGATVSLSDVAPGDSGELHVVLRVRDDGKPAMFAYRRAVIAVGE